MFFGERGKHLLGDASKEFVIKKEMTGLVCLIEETTIEIIVSGNFTIKRRKVFSLDKSKCIYKITIENLREEISYLGVVEVNKNLINICPIVRSQGMLFGKINKKIPVNKRKNKVEFIIDSFGKIL